MKNLALFLLRDLLALLASAGARISGSASRIERIFTVVAKVGSKSRKVDQALVSGIGQAIAD